ncbi:hypothetical protein [Niabella hirudinis]|uniref:hypothetical protein n=1 Tax=Niabella hirudinis TaxID=1285929 RepID=UPI003EB851FE
MRLPLYYASPAYAVYKPVVLSSASQFVFINTKIENILQKPAFFYKNPQNYSHVKTTKLQKDAEVQFENLENVEMWKWFIVNSS